jgi:hypothetical protein
MMDVGGSQDGGDDKMWESVNSYLLTGIIAK